MYTEKKIKGMSNTQLIAAYNLTIVRSVKEENFSGGTTKRTTNDENLIVDEMKERFGIHPQELENIVNPV